MERALLLCLRLVSALRSTDVLPENAVLLSSFRLGTEDACHTRAWSSSTGWPIVGVTIVCKQRRLGSLVSGLLVKLREEEELQRALLEGPYQLQARWLS